ncbi:MAG: protein kinase domain-containing protein [Deltaproteobacteria bacterium]
MGERVHDEGSAGADHAEIAAVAAGSVIDSRYVIEAEIGRGGMGRVYAATDSKLGRRVAIKLLPPNAHNPDQLRRFAYEARAAAALHQQNVVEIYDVGDHRGEPYITSELLSGMTLRKRLESGPLPPAEAAGIALQLARALVAAHGRGIVHRDLKPENLFLDEEGVLKVLDFGIAKLTTGEHRRAARAPANDATEAGAVEDPAQTAAGAMIGTAGYMSPEQVRGLEIDHRSDIFSFGSILYEMLSGTRAFGGSTRMQSGFAILTRAPPALGRQVPRALSRIVSRCLEKDRKARFQATEELVSALEAASAALGGVRRGWIRRAVPWVTAIAAAVAAAVAGRALRPSDRPGARLAVLPFRDLGGDAAQAAFSFGLTEILTNKLLQAGDVEGGLPVVSATEVWKENVGSARAARETFGATLVLTGSVQRSGEKTIVTLDLVDTRSQLSVAAADVEVVRGELPRLGALAAQKAIELLSKKVGSGARDDFAKDPVGSSLAYEFYLQGRGYMQRYDRRENVETARRVFERALALDPTYALAHAGIAEADLRLFQIARDPALLTDAAGSASRAVELSHDLAPVHVTLGLVQGARGQWTEAIASFEQALRLEPRNVEALRELANAYDAAGRTADAEATYRRAVDLHHDSWAAYKELGVFYNRHDRLADAVPCFERVAELTPDSYSAFANLGGIYLRLGKTADAARALRRSLDLHPSEQAFANLGWLAYQEGRYADASDLYRKAALLTPGDDRLWGALGDALRWMNAPASEIENAYRRALAAADAQLALDRENPQLRSRRALYLAGLGQMQNAVREVEEAERRAPRDGSVRFRAGILREEAGDREGALNELRAAFAAGYSMAEMQAAPPLRALRGDARWQELVANMQAK